MRMLKHYQNQSLPQLAQLLRGEAITFSVLIQILQGECTDIFTDHENVIVCYSCHPWPVWAWCRDAECEENVMEIARCLKEHYPLEQGYEINLRYELLEALKKQDGYFQSAKRKLGLLSYRLDQIETLEYPCGGTMGLVREEEISSLVEVWQDMHLEMEGRMLTLEHCRDSIQRRAEEKRLYAWRGCDGKILALTARNDMGQYSKITSVYTLPKHRRNGYALNLVHGVTETILADGLIPILYTDADYEASNECYRKIGYRLVGRLISICK